MIIHPMQEAESGQATPYDSVWAGQEVPEQQPEGIERVMLAEDKLYVVLAVVLIVWIGLALLVYRTDSRIRDLERKVEERIPENAAGR